jgi:hypothetical protein
VVLHHLRHYLFHPPLSKHYFLANQIGTNGKI